jgi:hypothetical protein
LDEVDKVLEFLIIEGQFTFWDEGFGFFAVSPVLCFPVSTELQANVLLPAVVGNAPEKSTRDDGLLVA